MAPFGLDDPARQRTLLFVLLLAGGGYLFYRYAWSPLHDQRVLLEDRLATLEAYNDQARALTQPSRLAELRRRQAEFQVALAAYETLLPSEAEVSGLLEEVARAALEEDVEIVAFTPLDPIVGQNLVELPYDVQVQGGYHDIGRFLAEVANLPRLVRPAVLSLRAVQIDVPEGEPPEYEVLAALTLSTFMPPEGVVRGAVPVGSAAPSREPASTSASRTGGTGAG